MHDREAAGAGGFNAPLLLAGAGKMGGALLRAWIDRGYDPRQISVLEPQPSQEISDLSHLKGFVIGPPPEPPQTLVLAMKPQSFDEASAVLAPLASPATLVISILAGKTIANLASKLPQARAIVRAMPNLPAAVGRGMTALAANEAATPAECARAEALLGAAGRVEWLADEKFIDAVTAVSGSGPAYVFYLTEALARAGADLGLPAQIAERLARAAVEGAGELLYQCPASTAAELRENVTSPGGTTAAALEVLMAQDGLVPLVERAVRAAKRRAEVLAG